MNRLPSVVKKVQSPVEFIHTAFIEQDLPKLDAIRDAKILYGLFQTMQLAELIGVLAHNAQHNLGSEENIFTSPIPIGDTDETLLANRGLLPRLVGQVTVHDGLGYRDWIYAELTPRGVVAANMYALDPNELAQGKIVPCLREPFADVNVLANFSSNNASQPS